MALNKSEPSPSSFRPFLMCPAILRLQPRNHRPARARSGTRFFQKTPGLSKAQRQPVGGYLAMWFSPLGVLPHVPSSHERKR